MRVSHLTIALTAAMAALAISLPPATGSAADLADLYTSKAITTGTGEKNRKLGFRDCLDRVVVRVSGDQRLPSKPEMEALRARGGDFVASFSYVDRLAAGPGQRSVRSWRSFSTWNDTENGFGWWTTTCAIWRCASPSPRPRTNSQ